LHVAAALIGVISRPAALALGGDRSSGPRSDDGANRRSPAAPDRSSDDRTADAAQDRAPDGILRFRFVSRHRKGEHHASRHSNRSQHFKSPSNLIVTLYLWLRHGTSTIVGLVNAGNLREPPRTPSSPSFRVGARREEAVTGIEPLRRE
jgi:hypothetical protein